MGEHGLLKDLGEGATKAVLFDLDGTIFDSVKSHVEELEEIWRRLKLPAVDAKKVREIMARGQAFWDCLEELLPWMSSQEREDVKTRGIETDKELWKDARFVREFNRFVPGAVEVLKTLKRKGLSVGLVSSVKREWGDAV
ncbi:MAG: HAD hydrolase-like protein, partial [Thermodesulfobacteriota bacterium]|nr:HAD hydrolase-like protein [Thermodesulfobacteriota bacterium]